MSHKKQLKPSALLSPVPVVMVSCGSESKSNIVTVAWTGTVNSDPPMLSISLRKERFSHGIISETGRFAVNCVSRKLAMAADFCGVRSGRDVDKFGKLGLEKFTGESGVPMIAESPINFECKIRQVIELGSHDMFIAEITAVYVNEELIDDSGKIDLSKADLVAYCHGEYFTLGDPEGFFGYSVASPEVLQRRMKKR